MLTGIQMKLLTLGPVSTGMVTVSIRTHLLGRYQATQANLAFLPYVYVEWEMSTGQSVVKLCC